MTQNIMTEQEEALWLQEAKEREKRRQIMNGKSETIAEKEEVYGNKSVDGMNAPKSILIGKNIVEVRKCPICGGVVASNAYECPHCGLVLKKRNKSIGTGIFTIFFALWLPLFVYRTFIADITENVPVAIIRGIIVFTLIPSLILIGLGCRYFNEGKSFFGKIKK